MYLPTPYTHSIYRISHIYPFIWGCLPFLFVGRNHIFLMYNIIYTENNEIKTTLTEVGRARFGVRFPPLISPCLYTWGAPAVCVARLCVIFQFPRGVLNFFVFTFFFVLLFCRPCRCLRFILSRQRIGIYVGNLSINVSSTRRRRHLAFTSSIWLLQSQPYNYYTGSYLQRGLVRHLHLHTGNAAIIIIIIICLILCVRIV